MRAFVNRLLWNGLPVAVLLAGVGYGLSQMAEMMHGKSDRPRPDGVADLADHLQWRLPLGLAAWGFGLVLVFELLFSLWRKPWPAESGQRIEAKKSVASIQDEAEQLLLKLLAEAEAAERARAMPSAADPTPPPRDVAGVGVATRAVGV